MKNWIKSEIEPEKIVISSRVRLARNINNIPFPHKLDEEHGREIVREVEKSFYSVDSSEKFKTINLWDNTSIQNRLYLEKHLVSNKLLINKGKSAFIVDNDDTISLMINEEDHIRIQCITAGLDLKETFDNANKIDNLLENSLEFAFNERVGYLTACPTNSGTGLRASAMIHLPALAMEKEMDNIFNSLAQVGMTIRGLYGEGSRIQGNLYQISNQITLGFNEEEIINNLSAVIEQIITTEKSTREKILERYKYELEDKIYRSLAILKSSIIISVQESLELLSNVRLGVEMGIIKDVNSVILNELLIETSTAYIKITYKLNDDNKAINFKRAEIIREKFKSINI